MLKLQRASAGSGKTFTLARTYLKLFLTISENGKTRLRSFHEINDAITHILAVTFTNKATAEMKDRIISSLANLSTANLSLQVEDWPDYLKDFAEMTGDPNASLSDNAQNVVDAAKMALRTLLFNFSDFNVSTIDSFFQTILRTFAYETDLNDSYQLEIDSSQTISAGVDATLDSLLQQGAEVQTSGWIKELMDRAIESGNPWNPYQKSSRKGSVYNTLTENARKLESETFKEKREALDKYFSQKPDLFSICVKIDEEIISPIIQKHDEMGVKGNQLLRIIKENNIQPDQLDRNLLGRIKKATGRDPFESFSLGSSSNKISGLLSKGSDLPPHIIGKLEPVFIEFKALASEWKDMMETRKFATWQEYRKLLPYLPLLNIVADNIHELMSRQNSMLLSETNTLLNKIIDKDEAPFIYERLGARVNHYLIDEFQDTSRLQWVNFRPLLMESLGYDFENLIIGDAKQSIYRWRNADSDIITNGVTSDLGMSKVTVAGNTPKENTNWRSLKNIVDLNNSLFSYLSQLLDDPDSKSSSKKKKRGAAEEPEKPASTFFRDLYSNVVQDANKSEPLGYINVTFYKKPTNDDFESNDDNSTSSLSNMAPQFANAGEFVADLLKRGFKQKEIAYLVRTNQEGLSLVKAFIDYNSRQGADAQINFVSDESLLISSSKAVTTIIGILDAITKGYHTDNDKNNISDKKPDLGKDNWIYWPKIKSQYEFLASKYPNESPAQILNRIFFYDKNAPGSAENEHLDLANLLGELQSVALPSLVEAFVLQFVPDNVKTQEAPFISAFQDVVLEYCESGTTDISSFLDWWRRKGSKLSISSPEDLDAVKIMTIHKSKGLEFDVVVLPEANYDFAPSSSTDKMEWDWIKPDPDFKFADQLPPYIPVGVTKSLENTAHKPLYEELAKKSRMDALNIAYVAMTRASKELYVFSPLQVQNGKVKNVDKFGPKLYNYCKSTESLLSKVEPDSDNSSYSCDPPKCPKEEEVELPLEYRFGEPLSSKQISDLRKGKKKKDDKDDPDESTSNGTNQEDNQDQKNNKKNIRFINQYLPIFASNTLKYKRDESGTISDDKEDEDDPRTLGNILHNIMSAVKMPEDLPRATQRLQVRGIISEDQRCEFSEILQKAIKSVDAYGWFDPKLRVINERPLISGSYHTSRPDRMTLDPEDNLTIVDYKFGEKSDVSKYREQVAGYMDLCKRTGRFKSVKGFLWYVMLGKVEEVT